MLRFRKKRTTDENSAPLSVAGRRHSAPPQIDAAVPQHLETATFGMG